MTNAQEHGLGRVQQFDPRSRDYPIRALLVAGEQPRSYLWPCELWLDQGLQPACVGFSFAAELAAEPVPIAGLTNADGLRIYKAAQQVDEWPGDSYAGTSVLAGAKVMQAENRITEYRWAFGLDDLVLALGHKGPAVLGIPWYEAMFDPDASGLLHIGGRLAGGHAILAVGVDIDRRLIRLHNSWSRAWGLNGDAFISFADLDRLLHEGGEACIPLVRVGAQPAPPPQPDPEPVPMTIIDARNEVTNPRGNGATVKEQVIGIAVHHSVTQTPSEVRALGMADIPTDQGVMLAAASREAVASATAASTEASERAIIRAIDAYHVSVGYGGFAYHMAVFPSGRAYLCGDLGARRAHVAKRNHELLGVVLIGTFTTVQPGQKQMDGLREALIYMLGDYPSREIRGHREWALPGEGTECPGVVVPRDWEAFLQQEDGDMQRFNAVAAGFENRTITGAEWIDAQAAFGLPVRPRRVRIEVYLASGEVTVQDGHTGAYAGRAGWGGQGYSVVEAETSDGYFGLLPAGASATVAQLGIVAYA